MPLLVAALMCGAAAGPAVAQEQPPEFAASANSGLPGLRVNLSQVDPCPSTSPTETQYIEASFTDSAGKTINTQPSVYTDGSGNWNFPVSLKIPVRGIASLEPLAYTDAAAPGVGTLRVRCHVPSTGRVTDYAAQPFTVTGVSPAFFVSPGRVQPGAGVRIEAANPCPVAATRIDGVIKRGEVFLNFSAVVDAATRKWSVDVVIPKIYAPPMFPSREFPLGLYGVGVTCSAPGQGIEASYGASVLNVASAPIRYVALGDSYSSGEGTFDYFDTQGDCHRSRKAYPYLLATRLGQPEQPHLAACSGAITDDIFSARDANEPVQTSKISPDTEMVTITIGGNDALFEKVLKRCISKPGYNGAGCSRDRALQAEVDKQIAALRGNGASTVNGRLVHPLADVYREISKASQGRARLYVAGYPDLFGWDFRSYSFAFPSYRCDLAPLGIGNITYEDALWINLQALSLNLAIGLEVNEARRSGVPVTYVPPSTFSGHAVCDRSEAWINGVVLEGDTPKRESFHPSVKGHDQGYAAAFEPVVKRR